MQNITTFTISDDSGYIGIVNADKYKSFVNKDWDLSQLLRHFIDEMNNDNLIIWSTGYENVWTISFVDKPSDKKSFREFYKSLDVTNGRIFLTNYEDLTMAAQYEDELFPATHNSSLVLNLENGRYDFQIRQLFDPIDYDYDLNGEFHFEIVVRKNADDKHQHIDKIFWWKQ